MGKRLEFISYSVIRRDPQKLRAALKAKYPTVSDANLERITEVELWKHKPRLNHTEALLFGRDILTDDLTTIAAWDAISAKAQRFLQRHHTAGTLAQAVSIDGLSQTYVWNRRNAWVQEVADPDLPLIRASKAGKWFRDYDAHGPWPGFPRAWEFPVAEREAFSNLEDAAKFAADVRKKKTWAGGR